MPRKQVTIPDIARELGLSVGTVSNALNANRGQVSEATRRRVLDAAERLGYRGNRAASALRRGRQGAISLHIPGRVRGLSFYMDFLLGVSEATAEHDIDLLLATSSVHQPRLQVDGAVVVDWLPDSDAPVSPSGTGLPLVSAGRAPTSSPPPNAVIAVDYERLTREIVDGAISAGAARVGMLAPDAAFESDWSRAIVRGTRAACDEAGLALEVRRLAVDSSAAEVCTAAEELAADHEPDLVVFGAQRLAGIAQFNFGWGAPDSPVPYLASCAGDPITELTSPRISAIDAGPREFGERCARELLRIIEERDARTGTVLEQPARIHWADHWNPGGDDLRRPGIAGEEPPS